MSPSRTLQVVFSQATTINPQEKASTSADIYYKSKHYFSGTFDAHKASRTICEHSD